MVQFLLRAFFMMRTDDDGWTVTVCRDLGSVIGTWNERKTPNRNVGVLHVGFDRPPSTAFDEIAKLYFGRVLLTAAAKHAMPSPFVASLKPVACVKNIEVFVGLQGWGYTIADPTLNSDFPGQSNTADMPREPQGWIASFCKDNPSFTSILSIHRVYDDASYLEKEEKLESDIRHHLGLYRIHYLAGPNCDDPCVLARNAPPWLARREVAALNLSVRSNNVFKASGIKLVQDLATWSLEALLNQRHYGKKSLQDTLQALNAALNEGPDHRPLVNRHPSGDTSIQDTLQTLNAASNVKLPDDRPENVVQEARHLLAEIRQLFLSLEERERDILSRRLGFEKTPETLREIADDHNVTRERIRQIENRAIQKWINSHLGSTLGERVTLLLDQRSYPLPVIGIEEIDPWFEGISYNQEFFKNFTGAMCKNSFYVIEIDGLLYFSFIDQETWTRAVEQAKEFLSSQAGQEWGEDYARSLAQRMLPSTAKEFEALFWNEVSGLCHFSTNPSGLRVFAGYGRGVEPLTTAVLVESDKPLHFTEIARHASIRAERHLDPSLVHNTVAKFGLLFARGTYGLDQHVPLSNEQMSRICAEAEDVVSSGGPTKQWHTSEILMELLERLEEGFETLDKYLLGIILTKSHLLKPLGRMTWVLASSEADGQERIDIQQAVRHLIESSGHPLNIDEIKEHLTTVRGVGAVFHVLLVDPLVRVAPGVWGINDRDVPISRQEQKELMDELVHILHARKTDIHSSELSDVLNLRECTPDMIFSIAAQDDRMKLTRGKYVRLSEWEASRRTSIPKAIMEVLKDAREPLALEEIIPLVEQKTDRSCKKGSVYHALRALEVEFDANEKKWSLEKPSKS